MKEKTGFTLIEVLIVVGVLGVLAAIAIPQFGQYRENARRMEIQNELRNCLADALAAYTSEGSGSLPRVCDGMGTTNLRAQINVADSDGDPGDAANMVSNADNIKDGDVYFQSTDDTDDLSGTHPAAGEGWRLGCEYDLSQIICSK